MESVFFSKNHYIYLKSRLRAGPSERGIKTRFAEALQTQPAFLSQVLSEKYALSLEQADRANHFFEHSVEESEFFLLLVSRDRAGTTSLKKHYEQQIQLLIQKRRQTMERLEQRTEVSYEIKGIYYSSWIYPVIHIACATTDLKTPSAIARRLNLPLNVVNDALTFLESSGLLIKNADRYDHTQNWVRLDKKSPHVVKHHANLRLKAIQNLETKADEDLHYSAVYSMDATTATEFKDLILNFMKSNMKKIEDAPAEDLYIFNTDFFRV